MANLNVKKIKEDQFYGAYEIYPFEKGWGNTLAVALRRVLLSSIQGAAITKMRVRGVDHEFSTLKGVKEDVLRIRLNLQQVVLDMTGSTSEKIIVKAKGPKKVFASDIETPGNVRVINPDLFIAELTTEDAELYIEAFVEVGSGFKLADDEIRNLEPGTIPMDRNFSPILKVNYNVEATRVAQRTDFEKIFIEIWSNGGVAPYDALLEAVDKLQNGVNELKETLNAEINE
ncbi:MAG: hypothetical protein KatS3mg084_0457 [Candidatus Dojkabacteria bacterium]|nr:MAG: hypothetical protein KatS3mg084_0457 [Candidatus Dojkabacteria bacterium]